MVVGGVLGQFGTEQFGPGQFGTGQFGPGQFGTRTIRYQDNSVPGQLIYILLRILFMGETQKRDNLFISLN